MNRNRLDLRRAFLPIDAEGRYVERMYAMQGRSGVYCIIDGASVVRVALYVGESHTGRLFDTCTRHFRSWRVNPARDPKRRFEGGATYPREGVHLVFVVTPADRAVILQEEEIARLDPRDNIQGFPDV